MKKNEIIREKILEYWNEPNVESMYDKNLINIEIDLIKDQLTENSIILDAGCGEGEGTFQYAKIKNSKIVAADFSETRLMKSRQLNRKNNNIEYKEIDFLSQFSFDVKFDYIICQRFLINLISWKNQSIVLKKLSKYLRDNGKLILLEGSMDGVDELDMFRKLYGLNPISVKWHNVFFKDEQLEEFMESNGLELLKKDGLGAFYFLTRGIRPIFETELNWNTNFNKVASLKGNAKLIGLKDRFSRTKLWVFNKL